MIWTVMPIAALLTSASACGLGNDETATPSETAGSTETAPDDVVATPVPRGVVAAATRSTGAPARSTAMSGDVAVGEGGMWVTGTGQITMEPDLVILNLGVETFETTVAEANSGAAMAMNAVMGSLRSNGVEDRDMQTHGYNVWPQYEWVEVTENGRRASRQKLIGFKVVNSLKAKVRDLDAVGGLIDQVVTAGGDASRFNGLQFTVEDTSELMEELREEAVRDAMAKAQHIADTVGVSLGSLAARLRISWRALRTGEVRRRQLLLPGAAIDGPMDSYVSLC